MIVMRMYGGLAGQMFQYSLGRHLSIKQKEDLYLDVNWYKDNTNPQYPREFRLDKLNTKFKILNGANIFWKVRQTHRLARINPFKYKLIQEKDYYKYDHEVFEQGGHIIVDGFWNCYKYLDGIKDILVEELAPRQLPDERNQYFLNKVRQMNSVSVHFRRGDYKETSFHGILNREYYEKALNIVCKDLPDPYLFIFSDEPEWVMNNMQFDHPFEIIDFNRDDNNYRDIELMKNCKHNIIANSGFSWWGAWLNTNPGKKVVAPKHWISDQSKSTEDLIPSNWIRL